MERRPRLLVVEDDPDQRFLYVEFLGREGFDIRTAASVEEARGAMREASPDALLLDLSLSGDESLGFIAEVRADPSTRHLPVLVISGSSPNDPRLGAGTGGWDHFLQKPTDLVALAELLRKEIGIA